MTAEHSERPSREQLFREKYSIAVKRGGQEFMDKYRDELFSLHNEVYKPLIPDTLVFNGYPAEDLRIYDQDVLESAIDNPDATFVFLQDKTSQRVLGFTCAFPSSVSRNYPDEQQEFDSFGLTTRAYRERQQRTAKVSYTMIRPEHRGTGSWSHMMDTLEQELTNRGFREMVRVARQEDLYADKVRGRYQGRIVTEIPDQPSYVGLQTYFRVEL